MEKLTIIESCDFQNYPTGGNLIFVKLMIRLFGPDLILVGITTDNKCKIGKWTTLNLDGYSLNFFPVVRSNKDKRGIIPSRIKMYLGLILYKKRILKNCSSKLITGTPEAIGVFYDEKEHKIYHIFQGTGNALKVSRYAWARLFAIFYDRWLAPKVAKAHKILAAADKKSIEELEQRSKGLIKASKVIQFPTRVDETIFRKMDKNKQREKLSLQSEDVVVVTCGRLIEFKGWRLLIDSFKLFKEKFQNAVLFFIGDGDDHKKILRYVSDQGMQDNVILLGRQDSSSIAMYLNAADLFIMGSMQEGWSTTLVEAACVGVPCVATNFSSAKEIITDGLNGYVVEDRNAVNFSKKMMEAIMLDRTNLPTIEMDRFSLKNMKQDLLQILND